MHVIEITRLFCLKRCNFDLTNIRLAHFRLTSLHIESFCFVLLTLSFLLDPSPISIPLHLLAIIACTCAILENRLHSFNGINRAKKQHWFGCWEDSVDEGHRIQRKKITNNKEKHRKTERVDPVNWWNV